MESTSYVYKTVGRCEIRADVFRPENSGNKITPVIVRIHGGALINGGHKTKNVDPYPAEGYTVISIAYRKAPETKLPEIIKDLQDAFRWIQESAETLFIDTEKMAVIGWSAGGYLALMAGFCVTPRPKAIVSFYGYGNIMEEWYLKPSQHYRTVADIVSEEESGRNLNGPECTEPYEGRGTDKFYLYCRQNGTWTKEVGGRDPEKEPEFFKQYCPIENVDSNYPPTILLHGNKDTDVPYEQSVMMADEFVKNDIEHEFIILDGLGHCFDGEKDNPAVKDAMNQVIKFLKTYIK
jgi:acetyl esterase/lipase